MKNDTWRKMMYGRVFFLASIFILMFLLIAFRLWQVQVIQEEDHLVAVERQSIRPERINAVRGRIYDAHGVALVDNQAKYDIGFYVSEMRRPGRLHKTIGHILDCEARVMEIIGREPKLTVSDVNHHITMRPGMPLIVASDLSQAELARFSEMYPMIEGVRICPRIWRWHPYPCVASHLLGYTGWKIPDGGDVADELPRMYVSREIVGKSGLEYVYNEILAGTPGSRKFRVDSIGYVREEIGKMKLPSNGSDLYLTIDLAAQQAAEKVLQGKSGALVAVEVNTGAIVAMASSPGFDLSNLTSAELVRLNNDAEHRPMINRATRGVYIPGSIVKPLVALAVLQNGVVSAEDEYFCDGAFKLGKSKIRCARRFGHGTLDLNRAIYVSCNPFFINAGVHCGIDKLAPFFAAAGFGEHSGIEIADAKGIAPHRTEKWSISDTAYVSIGQGKIGVTPLQAAMYASALANGGIVYRPYLVAKICSQDGTLQSETQPQIRNRLPVSPENLSIVAEAMHQAVLDREGGAIGLAAADYDLAGKTGTAEVGTGEKRYKNAWTIAFGPFEEPRYAVACVIEHGDSGGRTAVPLVAEFFKSWLTAK